MYLVKLIYQGWSTPSLWAKYGPQPHGSLLPNCQNSGPMGSPRICVLDLDQVPNSRVQGQAEVAPDPRAQS